MSSLPTVHIENFEGPFDLLLELAQANKVDLTRVALASIADDFLQFVKTEKLPALSQADFIIVASTLLLLKMRQLLPALQDEEEVEINQLTDRLCIYQLYREQAIKLRDEWQTKQLLPGPEHLAVSAQIPYPAYTPKDLAESLLNVISRIKKPLDKKRHLRPRGRSLQECFAVWKERLKRVRQLAFHDVVAKESPQTTAVSLLALLELARQQQVSVSQANLFDTIIIEAK